MTAGVLPAPTPTAGLPELYAAFTMPGPPVARIMSASFIIIAESGTVGSSIQPIISSGAPAFTAASRTILAASMVLFLALGCGEMIKPFLVLRARRDLNIAVEVGLVVGMIAAITPTGSAILVIPNPGSYSRTPQVFTSL